MEQIGSHAAIIADRSVSKTESRLYARLVPATKWLSPGDASWSAVRQGKGVKGTLKAQMRLVAGQFLQALCAQRRATCRCGVL